ncbi:MAG: hypothetical protein WA268_22395, partial [Xanthobacteraceae bacterium]
RQAAHQAGGRLAAAAPVTPAWFETARSKQGKHLAIKPPRRRMGIVGELFALFESAALQKGLRGRLFGRRFVR